MSKYAFGLKTPQDLLKKLERELHHFRSDVDYRPDHAFNFVVTAWHVTEWVCKYYSKEEPDFLAKFGCKNCDDFKRWVRSRCEALDLCGDLANGSKHFELREKNRAVRETDRSATNTHRLSREGAMPAEVLKVRKRNGTSIRASRVFTNAVQFWQDFLRGQSY